MPKYLDEDERKELNAWLTQYHLSVDKLNRDCSDCVLIANLLKSLYPRIVELHNYPPRNSFKLKLVNWETMNFKVLKRIGIPQNKKTLEQLSNGVPVVLEKLLYDIMCLEILKNNKPKFQKEEEEMVTEDDTIIMNVNKMIGDALIRVPQKMIRYTSYQKALEDMQHKKEILNEYDEKIANIEELLREKSLEIDSLCNQLALQTVANLMEKCKAEEQHHPLPRNSLE